MNHFPLPEKLHPKLHQAKNALYPPYFSSKSLADTILELTNAELDVPLQAVQRLDSLLLPQFPSQSHNWPLLKAWNQILESYSKDGVFYPPEHFFNGHRPNALINMTTEIRKEIFKPLDQFIQALDILLNQVQKSTSLDHKDEITSTLSELKTFYSSYQGQVLNLLSNINLKRHHSYDQELADLTNLLKPKALLFGDIFPHGPAFRVSQELCQGIIKLDEDKRLMENTTSSLPFQEPQGANKPEPRVIFKHSSSLLKQLGQDELVCALYRILDIPIPCKSLVVFSNISPDNDNFYLLEAFEAINPALILEDILLCSDWPEKHHQTFCLQALGTLLTSPSNANPFSFIYDPTKYGLIPIKMSSAFNPALSPPTENNTYMIQTKSLVYLLRGMDRPLPSALRNSLQNLSPDFFILTWLKILYQRKQYRSRLISGCLLQIRRGDMGNDGPEPLINHLLDSLSQPYNIPETLVDSIKGKLELIIKTVSAKSLYITPQNLLMTIFPTLGIHYKELRSKIANPIDAWWALLDSDPALLEYFPLEQETKDLTKDNFVGIQDLYLSASRGYLKNNSEILDKFVQKFTERFANNKQINSVEVLRELLVYIELGIKECQDPKKFVDLWYKVRKDIPQESPLNEICDQLFSSVENQEIQWYMTIEKNFPRGWQMSNPEGWHTESPLEVRGATIGKRQLSEELIEEVLDEKGSLCREIIYNGNRCITKFPAKSHRPIFYFKKGPEISGYEYAVTMFLREFGVEGVPFCELLVMKDPKEGLYSALLVQAVGGEVLEKIWEDDMVFGGLESEHTQLLILGSMLLNPEDGRGSNFVLTPDHKRIIPIHNDHAFVKGTRSHEESFLGFKSTKTELVSKTVLYCLHEMNRPILKSVAKRIRGIDVDVFLRKWLEKLVKINENLQELVSEEIMLCDGNRGIFYRIGFPANFIERLYEKFHKMQQIITRNKSIKPLDLLKALEPNVYKIYMGAFQQESTVYDRFMNATDDLYKHDKIKGQVPRYNSLQLLHLLGIPLEEVIGKNYPPKQGPREALHSLVECSKIHKQMFDYASLLNGEMKIDVVNAERFEDLLSEESYLKEVLQDPGFHILALENSCFLRKETIPGVFAGLCRLSLRAVIIPGARNLTGDALKILGESLPNLESLNIGNNENLRSVVISKGLLKNLKHLNVSGCSGLIYLEAESGNLKALEISHNKNLKIVGLKTPKLSYLDCTDGSIEMMYLEGGIRKLEVLKPSGLFMEGKMIGLGEFKKMVVVEVLISHLSDKKGTEEILQSLFPNGFRDGIEKITRGL